RCGMAGIFRWLSTPKTNACSLLSEIQQSWRRSAGELGGLARKVVFLGAGGVLLVGKKSNASTWTSVAGLLTVYTQPMRSTHALRGYRLWPELERVSLFQRWIACCWAFALALKSRLPSGFIVRLRRQWDEFRS